MAEKESKSVQRWDPFAELDLFEGWDPFREIGPSSRLGRLLDLALARRGARPGLWNPAVDVSEDDTKYVVTVEVPGAKKDDVTVETSDNVLTIRGEKRNEREEKKEKSRWIERSYGSFSRSFTLPPNADAEHVDAHFKDGVLTVEIRKTEESKPRVVSIKS